MHLTLRQITPLANALVSLDGYDRVTKDGANERIVRETYKFGAGLRMAIAKNLLRLNSIVETYQKERNAIIKSLGSGGTVTDPADIAAFNLQDQEWQDAIHSVELIPIAEAELRLNENAIASTTLMGLAPLLDTLRDALPAPVALPNGRADQSPTA